MKIAGILFFAVSLALGINLASAESSPNTSDGQMRALKQSVDDAFAAYQASTSDAGGRLWQTYKQLVATNLPQVLELAQKNPASKTSFEMFSWIAMQGLFERGPIFMALMSARKTV